MKIRITNTERKAFAKNLAERLGQSVEYKGVPSFAYQVGPYTICRDNTMEVEEALADKELLRELTERDLLDGSWDKETQMISIALPLKDHSGRTLTNLIRMLACRQDLINHAIGYEGFQISDDLIAALNEKNPETVEAFMEVLTGFDEANYTGFAIEAGKLQLQGFPYTSDPDRVQAYMQLASLMNRMAIKLKRVMMEKPDLANEKYSFRIWLLRLGMVGPEFKKCRAVLLKKLSGNSAFRTDDQKEAFYAKLKEKRESANTGKEGAE